MRKWVISFILIISVALQRTEAIQCYSCQATGSNEIDANIRCLEQAYLENCEEFYRYYNEVEDYDPAELDYYGYGDEDYYGDAGEYADEYYDENYDYPYDGTENYAQYKESNSRTTKRPVVEKTTEPEVIEKPPPGRRQRTRRASSDNLPIEGAKNATRRRDTKSVSLKLTAASSSSLGEHYCYSKTSKGKWESYTVEKGCKKISYCKASIDNKPAWKHPWNFCCDRSRCNVKLVKDKPQRVYGMGCRRTDDCIQGHNERAVCPHFFKSCPKISHGLIKMECRPKSKNTGKYRMMQKEKKCYCGNGYFPKGPICTNSNDSPRMLKLNNLLKIFTFLFGLLGTSRL